MSKNQKTGAAGPAPNKKTGKKSSRQKQNRDYENEEWRTVYIGFVERGTSEEELAMHFKDSGEIERLTLKDGFAFILFKKEDSVPKACKLDGTGLRGLNLRVAPRKEKPPDIDGELLLTMEMKTFRHERCPNIFQDISQFEETFKCVGSFSQDKKLPNSIIIPGCPPTLDWSKMDAEEGEITLERKVEDAPELSTSDSIFEAVKVCSPGLDFSTVSMMTNRQCLMKLLHLVDPSIVYANNKCFKMVATREDNGKGPVFLNLEAKWHPSVGTAKSFQDAITNPLPLTVKNIASPGIFYRINQFKLGDLNVMVRNQVHAEDEFQDEENENEKVGNGEIKAEKKEEKTLKVDVNEFVPRVHKWNEIGDFKWVKNDQIFVTPESRYEVKTVDIAGNFWEYNAEKTFYQMLLGGVDYLLLGVLLNNEYVINKEEYDLAEVHTKVLGTKNPTDATLVLTKMEKILKKIVALCEDLTPEFRLEIVLDGRNDTLAFHKVKVCREEGPKPLEEGSQPPSEVLNPECARAKASP